MNDNHETWKDIPDYEGRYKISNTGRIKTIERYDLNKNGHQQYVPEKTIKIYRKKAESHVLLTKRGVTTRFNLCYLMFLVFKNIDKQSTYYFLDNNPENLNILNIAIIPDGFKQCGKCNDVKNEDQFYSYSGYTCKECVKNRVSNHNKENAEGRKIYMKEWAEKNYEKVRTKRKIYVEENKEMFTAYFRKYAVEKRKNSDIERFKHNLRNRLWGAFKKKSWRKDGSEQLLGCSFDEAKNYITSQFQDNMSWENYGKWHIDHIIPLSSAKTKAEMEALCHYTNLQPLWARENISKGNKIIKAA